MIILDWKLFFIIKGTHLFSNNIQINQTSYMLNNPLLNFFSLPNLLCCKWCSITKPQGGRATM